MRTIICGSREVVDRMSLVEALDKCGWTPTVVLCGMARGADALGKSYAEYMGIPVEEYPANWELHGKAGGHFRNVQMAENAEAVIALWDGVSAGTKDMIREANKRGLRVYIHKVGL